MHSPTPPENMYLSAFGRSPSSSSILSQSEFTILSCKVCVKISFFLISIWFFLNSGKMLSDIPSTIILSFSFFIFTNRPPTSIQLAALTSPLSKTAMLVVPPPMSILQTVESSFSDRL